MLELLKKAIDSFSSHFVLVVGDIMLDQYTYGEVSRVSPEAPVPVLKKQADKYILGGAANVVANLATLGAKTALCGFVGNDARKDIVLRLLAEKNIESSGIVTRENSPTTLKMRLVSGGHQLLRLDDEERRNLSAEEEAALLTAVSRQMPRASAVILSDYDKGCFSESLVRNIIALAQKERKMIIADIKPQNKDWFKGVNVLTPNLKEGIEMTGLTDPREVAKKLSQEFDADIFLTLGADGIHIFSRTGAEKRVPSKKVKVFDVSGAGDTVAAVAVLGILGGLQMEEAAALANHAAAVVVQKSGTAVLTADELMTVLGSENHIDSVKIVPKIWGYEKWLENNNRYCCKLLSLKRGFQCSLHYHKKKDEMFFVLKGHVKMEVGDEVLQMMTGQFVRIPPETKHRFTGVEDSEIMEISTHHDENDSFRLEASKKVNEFTS